jgi:hypothetical protein
MQLGNKLEKGEQTHGVYFLYEIILIELVT